jgi:hypothetical protein
VDFGQERGQVLERTPEPVDGPRQESHEQVCRAAARANALANSAARAVTGRRSRSMSDTVGCETPRCAASSVCDRFALNLSSYSSSLLIGFSWASRYAATSRAFLAMGDPRAAAATSRAADATSARVTGAGVLDVLNVEVPWAVTDEMIGRAFIGQAHVLSQRVSTRPDTRSNGGQAGRSGSSAARGGRRLGPGRLWRAPAEARLEHGATPPADVNNCHHFERLFFPVDVRGEAHSFPPPEHALDGFWSIGLTGARHMPEGRQFLCDLAQASPLACLRAPAGQLLRLDHDLGRDRLPTLATAGLATLVLARPPLRGALEHAAKGRLLFTPLAPEMPASSNTPRAASASHSTAA